MEAYHCYAVIFSLICLATPSPGQAVNEETGSLWVDKPILNQIGILMSRLNKPRKSYHQIPPNFELKVSSTTDSSSEIEIEYEYAVKDDLEIQEKEYEEDNNIEIENDEQQRILINVPEYKPFDFQQRAEFWDLSYFASHPIMVAIIGFIVLIGFMFVLSVVIPRYQKWKAKRTLMNEKNNKNKV